MPYTFKIDKLTDVKTAYENLEEMARKFNGKKSGENMRGGISSNGFEGSYTVGTKFVKIAIHKNPIPFVSNKRVESEIEGFLVKLFHGHNA